jgi:mannosyltransferase OCH1-like enzyme
VIPRKLHFVWMGPNPIPGNYIQNIEAWRVLHPGWTLTVWQDADVWPIHNREVFASAPETPLGYTLRADIFRHEVLFSFGGIYLDMDVEPVKALDDLRDCEAFACDQGQGLLGTAVLGTVAHNPTWKRVIDALPASIASGTVLAAQVGPDFITPIIRDHVTVLPQEAFFPYLWTEPEKLATSGTYGIHRWAGSWL